MILFGKLAQVLNHARVLNVNIYEFCHSYFPIAIWYNYFDNFFFTQCHHFDEKKQTKHFLNFQFLKYVLHLQALPEVKGDMPIFCILNGY